MTTPVDVTIHRQEPMSLVVRSRVCRHKEGLLLTRADVHPYIIWELESSPNVLRAVGPHLHWEFLTCRSTAGVATVTGSGTAKIYQSFFWFAFPPGLAHCVATQAASAQRDRGRAWLGAGVPGCPLQLQLWLGQPRQTPSYSVTFACQKTKEARLKKKVQQNSKKAILNYWTPLLCAQCLSSV